MGNSAWGAGDATRADDMVVPVEVHDDLTLQHDHRLVGVGVQMRNFSAMILHTEAQQRTMLRLSLEADPVEVAALPLRQGRAIGWIAEALDGLHEGLSDEQRHQLVFSIRATIGIEAIVWLVDVAGLTRNDAVALTRWSAQALLQQASTVPPPTPSRPRSDV